MNFKLYGQVFESNPTKFNPFPGQGEDSYFGCNYLTQEIKITESSANFGINLLALIDDDICNVISYEAIDKELIPLEDLKEIKEYNKKVSNNKKYNNNIIRTSINIPEDLFIEETSWDFLLSSIEFGFYPMLLGPKGNGKTTTAYSLASALGYSFFKLDCGTLSKPKTSLVGQTQALNGSTFLMKSEFLNYYISEEKVLIFLDEISRIPTQAANYLMTILDENNPHIYVEDEAKIYKKGKNVTFIAAGNFGIEYTDARVLDGALEDRFVKFYFDYLNENDEFKLIKMKLNKISTEKVEDSEIKKIIMIANKIRTAVKDKEIVTNISTRKVLHFCSFYLKGFSSYEIIYNMMRSLFKHDSVELEYFDNVITALL